MVSITEEKRTVQSQIAGLILDIGRQEISPLRLNFFPLVVSILKFVRGAVLLILNGRHERIRTADLYRVKVAL